MNKPTEAQIKEFWEGYGFKYEVRVRRNNRWYCWIYPDGREDMTYPPIDLNSLFKYAVSKAVKVLAGVDLSTKLEAYYKLFDMWLRNEPVLPFQFPSADGLFWALWQVKEARKPERELYDPDGGHGTRHSSLGR